MRVDRLLKSLGAETYIVERMTAGTFSETTGVYSPGPTTQLSIQASVQPLGPEEVVSIPEGDRARERFRFYSEAPLQLGDTATGRRADVVIIGGKKYMAETVERWVKYTKTIVVKVIENAE